MKMTKNLKKLLALSVGASMTLSLCTGLNVSAQPFSQPDVINVFDTLYGYSKTLKQPSATLPANLTVPAYEYRAWGVASDASDENDTAIKIVKNAESGLNGAMMTWVFDEVIRKGTITISFDMKFPWNSEANDKNSYFYIERVPTLVNDNPTDYFKENDENGNPTDDTDHRRLMSINESDVSDGVINAGTPTSDAHNFSSDIAKDWHKYTITYNAETGESVLYLDGQRISSGGNDNTGTKRININTSGRANAVDNEILIDNIYIRHSQSELGEIPAKADYAKNGVKQNGGVVKMAFAETLQAFGGESEYLQTDFVLKDSNGGVIENGITNVEQDSDKQEIKFTLGNLSKGSYTIGLSEAAKSETDQYKGVLSGKFPGEIIFSTEGNAQNQQDARRYYVNENFEGYNGGMANGMASNLFGFSNAPNMTKATDTQNGNNLSFNTIDMAIWKFDESIKGGVFNIEFDVKSNGGRWGLHLLKARDFLPQNYVPGDYWETLKPGNKSGATAADIQEPTLNKDLAQYNYYNKKLNEAQNAATEAGQTFDKDAWLVDNWVNDWRTYRDSDAQEAADSRFNSRRNSLYRSHVLGTTENATKYSYSTARDQWSTWGASTVGSTFPEATSEWTHIKVKVDTEAAKYYLTVGDKTVELPYDQRKFNIGGSTESEHIPGYATSYDINTGKLKVTPGFGGIGLFCAEISENKPVQFDNVKVYTDDSYNSYSTFDNVARGTLAVSAQSGSSGVDMPDWFFPEGLNTSFVQWNPNCMTLVNGDGRNKTENPSDKSLMINCPKTGAGSLLHMLNVPIKSGREFNIEFDYKCDQEQAIMLGLVEGGNILPYSFNQWNKLDGQDLSGKTEDTKTSSGSWDDSNKYTSRVILYNRGENDSAQVGDRFRFRNGTNAYLELGAAGMQDAVSKDDETKTIGYKKGQWHHIKLNVKPNGNVLQETLTVKYEDGTSVTSQAYNTNLASVNDIAALLFRFNDARAYVTANNAQHLIDNLAVYEVGDVNNTYLTNVFAIDADGTESVINDDCRATTKQLKLNFSGKLASTKGISIGTAGETALTPEYTLSNDKTSVLVSFNRALLPDEKINIAIGSDLDTERESYLQKAEPYSAQITVTAAEGELKLAEARLYKWVDSRTHLSEYGNVTTMAGYYPMGAEVLNDVTSKDKFKLVVKGTNFSGSDYEACIMQCVYDSSNRLIDINIIPKKINQGVFDMSQEDISCAKENAAKIKFYVWRDNTLIPVANYLDYDVTTTAAEQPTE